MSNSARNAAIINAVIRQRLTYSHVAAQLGITRGTIGHHSRHNWASLAAQ